MTTLTILRGALALIVKPDGWTQGAGARDANGDMVKVLSPEARCFCPVAAIGRTVGVTCSDGTLEAPEVAKAIHMVGLELARADLLLDYPEEEVEDMEFGPLDLVAMNDCAGPDETHGDLVAAFAAAIQRERGEIRA